MKSIEQGVYFTEDENRQLGYVEEFKRLISENKDKHILKRFKDLEKQLEASEQGTNASDSEMSLTLVYPGHRNKFFKVQFGNEAFFVKSEKRETEAREAFTGHNSINEIASSAQARKKLKEIPGVELIDFQMAFRDKQNNYFVSKWSDLPNFYDYIEHFDGDKEKSRELSRKFAARMTQVESILNRDAPEGDYYDTIRYRDLWNNVLYDEKSDKIVLYDLHKGSVDRF